MRAPSYSSQFHRDVKRLQKRGKNLDKLIELLLEGEALPAQYKDHPLQQNHDRYTLSRVPHPSRILRWVGKQHCSPTKPKASAPPQVAGCPIHRAFCDGWESGCPIHRAFCDGWESNTARPPSRRPPPHRRWRRWSHQPQRIHIHNQVPPRHAGRIRMR